MLDLHHTLHRIRPTCIGCKRDTNKCLEELGRNVFPSLRVSISCPRTLALSFLALGENIRRHRRSLPYGACLVAGQTLLDHAELNSETCVFRRHICSGPCEKSICQAIAIVHAQGICRLEIVLVFSKVTQVSAQFTVHQYVPDQWTKLYAQLQEHLSQLVVSCASSTPTLTQSRTHRARFSDAPP